MSIIINKSTNDKVVVNKTTQETIKVATGIKGDVGPIGPTGPTGPVGDPGVHVGPTPPTDTNLLWVDTSSTLSGGSGQAIYGLVDPSNYQNLPAVSLSSDTSTAGWVVFNAWSPGASIDASFGVGSEAVYGVLQAGSQNPLNNATMYKNFSSPVVMTNRSGISFELRRYVNSLTDIPFEVIAATGADLTGIRYTEAIPSVKTNVWATVFISVPEGVSIRSVGIRALGHTSGVTDRTQCWFRNLQLDPISNVQVAQLLGKTPVVTESSIEGTTGHLSPTNLAPKLDLRRESAVHPGLGGWWDLREWGVPEDGVTDATSYITNAIEDLPPGAFLKFPAGKAFKFSGTLYIKKPITIDFNNCILYDPVRRGSLSGDFIVISNYVTDVTLLNGKIYATMAVPRQAGGNITAYAGTVVTSGSTAVLNTIGDVGEYIPKDQYVRWLGQHYEPEYGVINRFDVTLSGDGVSTATIEIVTESGSSLVSSTVTPPATPTEYTLRCNPPDLGKRLFLRVTKASGTAPILIYSLTPWGINTYHSAYEFSLGITVQNASRVLIENWWIEGVGGYGTFVQCFDKNLGHVTFRNVTCRANHTQNHAPVTGRYITYENCHSYESARTGFDCEPYGTGWALDHITLKDCTSRNDRNYSISCANWGLITNLRIENFKSINPGIAGFGGGSKGGIISGFTCSRGPDSNDMVITAKDMIISDLSLSNGLRVLASTWTVDGTYVSGGNRISDFSSYAYSQVGADYPALISILDGTSTISGGAFPSGDIAPPNPPTGVYYAAAARIEGRPPLFGLDVGRWRKVMPKTFKGLAMDGLWYPYGIDSSDSLVSTRGISSTTIRPQNFKQTNVAVTETTSSHTINFSPKPGSANIMPVTTVLNTFPVAYTGSKPVSLEANSSYYYSICGIVEYDDFGHRPRVSYGSSTTSGINNVISISTRYPADYTNQTSIAGFALYRGFGGTPSAGPWQARYLVRPTSPWYSRRQDFYPVIDTGDYLVTSYGTNPDREYGFPNMTETDGVLAEVEYGSWTTSNGPTTDISGYEWDTNYNIIITPSWITTVAVTAKRQSGFDVAFGTPAPFGATFDWVLIR